MFREEALHQSIKFTLVLLILPSLILVFLFLTELENAPQLSFLTKSFLQIIFGQITSFGIEISEMASIVGALKGGNLFRFFCFCFVCFLVIRPILKKCGIYLNTIHLDLVKNIYIANDNVTRAL